MASLRLSPEAVEQVPFTLRGQQAIYTDTELVGFGLRVGSYTKSFVVEKRVYGKPVRFTLGMHPLISVAKARELAIQKLAELATGRNLNAEKKQTAAKRHAFVLARMDSQPAEWKKNAKRLVGVAAQSGVYFLCKGDQVAYVGQSINVLSRVGQHLTNECFADVTEAFYIPCPPGDLNQLEAHWINALKPPINRKIPVIDRKGVPS